MATQCHAKTKKGERCKNEAKFIYCKIHLRSKRFQDKFKRASKMETEI